MAVRIDIRPRLTLREERPVKPRRFRLPPLALPAAAYWLAMAGLTYFFANMSENPFASSAVTTQADAPPNAELPEPRFEAETKPSPLAHAAPLPAPIAAADDLPESDPRPPPVDPASRDEGAGPDGATGAAEPAPRASEATSAEEARGDAASNVEPAPPRLTFPEFTDSSRAERRDRAADGPRIESLFERRADRPDTAPSAAPPAERDADGAAVSASCEAAVARNNESIELGAPRGPADVTREAYAGILQDGRYLSGCRIPERTVFEICAAVKNGRAVGITVGSTPPSPALNACVRRAVSRLKFPSNPRLDVTHTRFGSAR